MAQRQDGQKIISEKFRTLEKITFQCKTLKKRTKAQLIKELELLGQQVAQLQALAAELQTAKAQLAQLATFPEQNPNPVIETDLTGRATYLNAVAQFQFPELWTEGFSHPVLKGLKPIVDSFHDGGPSYVAREIDLGHAVYEQKICYTKQQDTARIRVYVHDITRRKRAEEAIQKLAKRVFFAHEEERQRVSRELHDEAGQALTALKLSLGLIRNGLPLEAEDLRQNLGEAIALTESAMEQIRLLARGLRPPALDTVGLNLTLEAYCRDFAKRTQLSIRYGGSEVPHLSDEMNICLYRVLQEALTNVVRHARATEVEVKLLIEGHMARLVVADNGQGPDQEAGESSREQPAGIGLLGMQERLELFGGWLELESERGRGVRLTAHLPMRNGYDSGDHCG